MKTAANSDVSPPLRDKDFPMSLRDDLAGILSRDHRYTLHGYLFVFEALEYTKGIKKKARPRARGSARGPASRHVTGRELCQGARELAVEQYGLLAMAVLGSWGIRSTSDIGEIVYNLIASGELEKTPSDSRSDFDDVYDFEDAFRRGFVLPLGEVA
jgi:uncharacterized repeat protein (TIGR04138 family)